MSDIPEHVYLPLEVAHAMSADAPADAGDILYVRAVVNERDLQTARNLVKRFGVKDGLFKGPRTLNAAEAIAQALSDARTRSPSNTEQRLREALQKILNHDDKCNCDHDTQWCCEFVGEFCPRCIAAVALQPQAEQEQK